MIKPFKIVALGLTSGVLVLLTSSLGLTGTVIGAVISSILYNAIQGYIDEKNLSVNKGNLKISKDHLDSDLFYILPLVIILFILVSYLFNFLPSGFSGVFTHLEGVTNDNLFKIMGIGLVVMGLFPAFQDKTVKRVNGILLVFSGITLLVWGFLDDFLPSLGDSTNFFVSLYFPMALIICIILTYVIVATIIYSFKQNSADNKELNTPIRSHNLKHNIKNYDIGSNNIKPSNRWSNSINHYKNNVTARHDPNKINKKIVNRLEHRNMDAGNHVKLNSKLDSEESENNINSSTDSLKFYSNKRH